MDDLLADFLTETHEMLEAVSGEIVAWEANPTDENRLNTIFRFVHTVKGNCGFFDFPRLARLSHAAEDALADARSGKRVADTPLVDAVLATIDRIAAILRAIETGEPEPQSDDEQLIARLQSAPDTGPPPTPAQLAPLRDDPAPVPPVSAQASPRSIRVQVDLLDQIMNGVSDLVLARNDLARQMRETGGRSNMELEGPFLRLSATLDEMRDAIARMRMQRIDQLYTAIPRLARDLAADLGKQAHVDLQGGEVELDRELIESIRDPLTHVIRNAIDHGIETPDARIAAGKPVTGRLTICARQVGNRICLIVEDDGAGLDYTAIRQKALKAGLVAEDRLRDMTDADLAELIFAPGLSTSSKVTGISGRGVGMDVVRSNLVRIGGSVSISSNPGRGTRITMLVPLTLSIIASLTVTCAGQRFALPQSSIREIIRMRGRENALHDLGDGKFLEYCGQLVPVVRLANALGMEHADRQAPAICVVVHLPDGGLAAFAVAQVHDCEDMVIRPVSPLIAAAGPYAGVTLPGDGQPMLLLDAGAIAARHGVAGVRPASPQDTRTCPGNGEPSAKGSTPVILFRDLASRRRAIALNEVRRIEAIAADRIQRDGPIWRAMVDGRMLPVVGLDSAGLPGNRLKALLLGEGAELRLLAVEDVVDTACVPAMAGTVAEPDHSTDAVLAYDHVWSLTGRADTHDG